MTPWQRVSCWVSKCTRAQARVLAPAPTPIHRNHTHTHTDTHTHTHVILMGFPWQQWLRERALILRYTYIACIVHLLCM
jgi:hypothetical protein